MNKKFFAINHQGKADVLIKALIEHGWQQTRRPVEAVFSLSDVDIHPNAIRLEEFDKMGIKNFLYPHAARPNLFHDFPGFSPSPFVTASFVAAQGHVDILNQIHTKHKLEVIGWFLCPLREFHPRKTCRKVIFAPIHPNSDGSLSDLDKKINRDTFYKLIPLVRAGEIELTVRFIRGLESSGLWHEKQVTYVQVEPRISVAEIDCTDLIISHQTFAALGVARGTPTIMMGEDRPPRVGSPTKGDFRLAKSWEKYSSMLMYPLDILAEDDILGLMKRAISTDESIKDWRERLIGEPFDPRYFVRTLESYL